MTTIVNIHHVVEYDVYCGRSGRGLFGPLGNPIVVGQTCVECGCEHGRDGSLLECYRRWLYRVIQHDTSYRQLVADCHGKVLGCFCVRVDGTGGCHAKVIAAAAAWLHGERWTDESRSTQLELFD